jgi:hypothetical protein
MKYAKPDCTTAIQSFGIKRVYYSYSECGEKFNDADEPKETYGSLYKLPNLTKKKNDGNA